MMPDEKLLAEMGKFKEELTKAGVMLAGDGLHPSSKGKHLRFAGNRKTFIDAPSQKSRNSFPATRYGR